VTHVFGFDIIPGNSTPRWVAEGLAEYQRGAWDPNDLAALREAVRGGAIPKISAFSGDENGKAARLTSGLGHAAFDFVEARWGKAGVRQFLLSLRQTVRSGGDPFQGAFRMTRDEFDRAFDAYLRERFTGAAQQSPDERFDLASSVRIEGDITSTNISAPVGLACIELWVTSEEGAVRQRWGVECGEHAGPELVRALRPGDRVVVTGAPARKPLSQRLVIRALVRPADGFSWAVASRQSSVGSRG
jgi:hypothetical protein